MRSRLWFLTFVVFVGCASSSPTPETPKSTSAGHLLDRAFVVYAANGMSRRDVFRGAIRSSEIDGAREERHVVVKDIGDKQAFVSWFEKDKTHGVQVVDFGENKVWTALPGEGLASTISVAELQDVGTLDGKAFNPPASLPQGEKAIDPAWSDATYFRGRWLEYTYGNGKFFRNEFHGDTRHSDVKRGLLKEPVVVQPLGHGKLFVSWVDERLGHVAQVVDLSRSTVWAAVPIQPHTQIWRGKLEGLGVIDSSNGATLQSKSLVVE